MADHATTTNRALGTRPGATFSTVQTAHLDLVTRLAATRPHRIRYIADAQDLEERAEHLRAVFAAMADYVGAIMLDTRDSAPVGSIDCKYVIRCLSDLAGDAAGAIANAADDLAAGRA
jgi:hypothetical protein